MYVVKIMEDSDVAAKLQLDDLVKDVDAYYSLR